MTAEQKRMEEARARARKVGRYIAGIKRFQLLEHAPIEAWSQESWEKVARLLGERTPSDVTQAAIIEQLQAEADAERQCGWCHRVMGQDEPFVQKALWGRVCGTCNESMGRELAEGFDAQRRYTR